MKPTRLEKYLIYMYKIHFASGMSREVLIPRGDRQGRCASLYQVGPHFTEGMAMEGLSNKMGASERMYKALSDWIAWKEFSPKTGPVFRVKM